MSTNTTPPPDAAVREAASRLDRSLGYGRYAHVTAEDINTLLSYVRAVQAPRPDAIISDAPLSLQAHISDLTRRLAEAEAAYKHVKQCLHISQGRAKRAEERIQELEDMRND